MLLAQLINYILYSFLHVTQNQMVERPNVMEPNENINDASAAASREISGQQQLWGLGHSVIPEAHPSVRNNLDFQFVTAENEKNVNNAEYFKDQFEKLNCDLLAIKNRMKEFEQFMNSRMSKMQSRIESQPDAPDDV